MHIANDKVNLILFDELAHLADASLDVGLRVLQDVFQLTALDATLLVDLLDRRLRGPIPPDARERQSACYGVLTTNFDGFILAPEGFWSKGQDRRSGSSAGEKCSTGGSLWCGLAHASPSPCPSPHWRHRHA